MLWYASWGGHNYRILQLLTVFSPTWTVCTGLVSLVPLTSAVS